MKEENEKTEVHAFIIRIYPEASSDSGRPLAVRGSIQHVASRDVLHFYHLDSIQQFIREHVRLEKRLPFQKFRNLLSRIWYGD